MIRSDDIAGGNRSRPLGLMVVHSPLRDILTVDLMMAQAIGAEVVELLPRWSELPDAAELCARLEASGMKLWSLHGPWGGQSVKAERVDLSDPEPQRREDSIDDVRRAADFAVEMGARLMVVHPGGLSEPLELEIRRDALTESLARLADHLTGSRLQLGVENMPKGVHPGSSMIDLRQIIEVLGNEQIGLVLDTGHGHISGCVVEETLSAGRFLLSTHVHDNNGRADSHLPPEHGEIQWHRWFDAIDFLEYRGPIMLECVKWLREKGRDPLTELAPFLRRLS